MIPGLEALVTEFHVDINLAMHIHRPVFMAQFRKAVEEVKHLAVSLT